MKKRFNFTSKNLLVVMVIVCIALILATMTSKLVMKPLRDGTGFIVAPFQNSVNRIGGWLSDQFSGFQDVQKLSKENKDLRAQIDELTTKNNALVQQQSELDRLESLYQLDKEYPQYSKVGAEVISKDPGNWYSTFIVNKGTADGIKVNMNVIAQGGLIGIVTEVGRNWAQVRSIIDDDSNISAMAQSTSEPCIVTGNLLSMDSGKIDFSGLRDKDNAVIEGASIVTSNISDKYLTGLLVGYVSDISMDSNNLTKSGTIIPVANFRSLREVLIITDLKQTKENSK
jgi:rod shape-determining protein MreC